MGNDPNTRKPSAFIKLPTAPGVYDVFGGLAALDHVHAALAPVLDSRYENDRRVFLLGDRAQVEAFLERCDSFCYDRSRLLAWPEGDFSLADSAKVDSLARQARGGTDKDGRRVPPVSFVVALFQEGREDFLPKLLDAAPWLCVWAVQDGDEVACAQRRDGASVPSIPPVPEDSMYGRAWELARSIECPMGFAYPAVLAAACGFGIQASGGIRPSLYACLVGDVGAGKSVAKDRAGQLFFGADAENENAVAPNARWLFRVPASDRVRPEARQGAAGQPRLLAMDEMRDMLGKGGIEGSTLMPVLCEAFYSSRIGVSDKKGSLESNARLSMLGCLKAKNAAEFQAMFSYASAHGLYDRMLFGYEPGSSWDWTPLAVSKVPFAPSCPAVPQSAYEAAREWKRAKPLRKRLAELALRVAYVSAAVNRDERVGEKAVYAALRQMEWQEKFRLFFQPPEGANQSERCVDAIEKAFMALPGREGNWRELSRRHHWHKQFSSVITQVRKTLESQGILVRDPVTGLHRLLVYEEGGEGR